MKKLIISIIVVMLTIILTVGATYAYFMASVTNNSTNTGTDIIEIDYTNGNEINDEMNLSKDKSGGFNTTLSIKKTEDSTRVKSNFYILINQIDSALATEGLVWEIYKTYEGVTTFENQGTFAGTKAGDKVYLLDEYYELTLKNADFTIYLWLNGDKVENEVVGKTFKGIIKAESDQVTGELS